MWILGLKGLIRNAFTAFTVCPDPQWCGLHFVALRAILRNKGVKLPFNSLELRMMLKSFLKLGIVVKGCFFPWSKLKKEKDS